jgi:hypothetical protein
MTLVENSLLTAVGEDALEQFQTLSTTEQAVHSGNTALGWHAMQLFKGLIEAGVKLAKEAVVGATSLEVTGIETKAAHVWNGGNSNTPVIVFRKLPEGVTSPKTNVAYFIINGTANTIELSATFKGAAIKIEGKALTVAGTEIAILASAEDNTCIGSQAGARLTTGGGNTLIGENAGVNLTSGEENIAIGCEALGSQQTGNNSLAIGFRSLYNNTTGGGLTVIGYGAGEENTTGNYDTAVGYEALKNNKTSQRNTAVGFETGLATTGEENSMLGALAGKSVTSGEENVLVGCMAANALTTGSENVVIGTSGLFTNKTGGGNVVVGNFAGEKNTGSLNIFFGFEAGKNETGSNKLYISNSETTEPLIKGEFPNASLALNATKIGFFKKAPIAQPAKPAETSAAIIKVLEELGLVA